MCIKQTIKLIKALTWGFDSLPLLPTQASLTPSCVLHVGTGIKLANLLVKEETSSTQHPWGFLLNVNFLLPEEIAWSPSPLHFSLKKQLKSSRKLGDPHSEQGGKGALCFVFVPLQVVHSCRQGWSNRCWTTYGVAQRFLIGNYRAVERKRYFQEMQAKRNLKVTGKD